MTREGRSDVSPAQALPRTQRIARRADFLRAYEEGRQIHGRFVVIFALTNPFGHPRLGVTATRKMGKAHVRNKAKRRVREVFRRQRGLLRLESCAADFVVNLKTSAAKASWTELERDLTRTLGRASREICRAGDDR